MLPAWNAAHAWLLLRRVRLAGITRIRVWESHIEKADNFLYVSCDLTLFETSATCDICPFRVEGLSRNWFVAKVTEGKANVCQDPAAIADLGKPIK